MSIVVPVHNESAGLERTAAAIAKSLPDAVALELVFVDDGSSDGTWAVCKRLAAADPRFRAVRFSRNFGKEAAMLCGLAEARGDAVVIMDADLQHPPALLPVMVDRWLNGADIVEARKARRGRESAIRRITARGFYRVMRYLAGVELAGATDFKLLDRKVVGAYLGMPEVSRFFRGLVEWTGFEKASIDFEVPDDDRPSRWSIGKLFALSVTALTAFSYVPLRMTALLGLATFVGSIVLTAYSVWMKLSDRALEGFTTVIICVLMLGGAILISLGIIGEYVARVYEEVKRRPAFLIAERSGEEPSAQRRVLR